MRITFFVKFRGQRIAKITEAFKIFKHIGSHEYKKQVSTTLVDTLLFLSKHLFVSQESSVRKGEGSGCQPSRTNQASELRPTTVFS